MSIKRGLWAGVRSVGKFLIVAWTTLAIYYSNAPHSSVRLGLAITFLIFSLWTLWFTKNRTARWVLAGSVVVVIVWFISIAPEHDRLWRREVGLMPRAIIEGDRVRLTGFRNFVYRSKDDFTVRYEEREVSLSHLTSIDFYISYWSVGPVAHTFLSFNFDNAPPVCISIETRPEEGEGFAPIASMFKQFELIYVVGDERDLVRSRTGYRDEEVYLYRMSTPPDAARRLFEVYLERINYLADHPEWYHLLKNNCAINILRYKNAAGREGSFDIRHLLNGWMDRYFYEAGMLDTSMPFEELRARSHINAAAQATNGDLDSIEFSRQIRKSVPGMKLSPVAADPKSD